ncbi:MAG: UDP-glucose 4-epimerase GalE [Proteobacteria bacterium]|nr:MAG: UDP-glucose 4-epimerase GalE [Pseudomonadota bacterium]
MTVLVTGGAGYIGSHTCRQLIDAGYSVVVLDNFYSGHRWAVPKETTLVEGDVGDVTLARETLTQYGIDAVIHFAGHIVVPESVANPIKYYRNNTIASCNLVQACVDVGVDKFIFSSTAAVYGIPTVLPVSEDAVAAPINPYGMSKLATEWILRDVAASLDGQQNKGGFRYMALRYFNVAGARLDGTLGQATPEATHLIRVAAEAACGMRDSITIFGTDYPTEDGTCVRDYIHVDDLAMAHLAALTYLIDGGKSQTLNCGYGIGFSVRQVLDTIQNVSNTELNIREGPRRSGDPPSLVANAQRIRDTLGWRPQHQDISVICRSAYNWEKSRSNTPTRR